MYHILVNPTVFVQNNYWGLSEYNKQKYTILKNLRNSFAENFFDFFRMWQEKKKKNILKNVKS